MYVVRAFAYFREFSTAAYTCCSIRDFLEFGDLERDIAECIFWQSFWWLSTCIFLSQLVSFMLWTPLLELILTYEPLFGPVARRTLSPL